MVLLTLENVFDTYCLPDKGIVWDVMLEDFTFVGQIQHYPAPHCWRYRLANYRWIGIEADKLSLVAVITIFRNQLEGK